jgi:light-regulated signal transduction histidine kinase (bacteriophytochrome)
MNNLLSGTGIATVFVDQGMKILRFTPAATEIINLMPGDTGRPVSHIASNLVSYDRLVADVRSVLDTLVTKEVEVETKKGRWFTLRIQPYRTLENVIEGAVITFIDITEAKEYKETLHKTIAQLETVNKELEGFTSLVSHDLRTPVRHMSSFAQLLKKEAWPGLNEKSRRYLNTVLKASRKLGALTDDLLEFTRIGNSRFKDDVVDLNGIITEVKETLAEEIDNRDIHWRVGALPMVRGDYSMLLLVFLNLIGNALKFTRSRSPAVIEIGHKEGETEYVFFIRDNGVGFDMKYYDKLFKAFQRLHASEDIEGTGIGLANVERVLERHSGRVWMEGKVDQGAVVYFSLPKVQVKQDD